MSHTCTGVARALGGTAACESGAFATALSSQTCCFINKFINSRTEISECGAQGIEISGGQMRKRGLAGPPRVVKYECVGHTDASASERERVGLRLRPAALNFGWRSSIFRAADFLLYDVLT